MRKITAVFLFVMVILCLSGCGEEKPTLDIGLEDGTLCGLRLGMSVEETKASGVFNADKFEIIYGDGVLPYDMAVVNPSEGVSILGEDSSLQMIFVDGKLGAAVFDLNMDMTGRENDFTKRDEFFGKRADLISSALENTLGKPIYYSAGGINGSVYPGDDDDEAIRHIVYFVKDGKLLAESDLKGKGLSDYYKNTDFDYIIYARLTKSFITSESELSTRSDAGIIAVQISDRQTLLLSQAVVDSQLSGRMSE